jgi:hypothetical protein
MRGPRPMRRAQPDGGRGVRLGSGPPLRRRVELRRTGVTDCGEPTELPTEVKEVLTLLVKSKTCGKGALYTTLEGQRDQGYASSDTHSNDVGA